jgi:hypothetical protein
MAAPAALRHANEPRNSTSIMRRWLFAASAALLCAASTAEAALWRAEHLPLGSAFHASSDSPAGTFSVMIDTDDNTLRIDLETGDPAAAPRRTARLVGPRRRIADDGVRLTWTTTSRGHVTWKYPETDEADVLAGRMTVEVANDGPGVRRGRIERLVQTRMNGASPTTLTLVALGFAMLSLFVVSTQRKRGAAA